MARNSQQSTINSFAYTHDGVGNRKTMADLNGVHGYDYDKIYQLTAATHPNMPAEGFQYDPVGNRLSTTVDLDNALLEDSDYAYAYDYNGNLIEKVSKTTGGKTSYFYDFENRLIKVESPGMLAQYKYDPFGRRIEKNVNGTITRYAYDGPNILLEYDGEGNIKSRYVHNQAIDDPMAVEQGGKVYYYQKDGLGSVVALTDETGQVVQSYEYDSFGKIISQTGIIRNPFTYTGREYDEETALYYYRARYYDPKASRFVTKDPIGLAAGDVNLYRYVFNNSINWLDPLGLYLGQLPPPPPGYDPITWRSGAYNVGKGKYWGEDALGRRWVTHWEDEGHWRHWEKPGGGRWPDNALKRRPGQKRLRCDQSDVDPSGDAPSWAPNELTITDPFDFENIFYVPYNPAFPRLPAPIRIAPRILVPAY